VLTLSISAAKLLQMAVAECLKTRDDRLVRGLVTVKRLRVLDRKLRAG